MEVEGGGEEPPQQQQPDEASSGGKKKAGTGKKRGKKRRWQTLGAGVADEPTTVPVDWLVFEVRDGRREGRLAGRQRRC